jgi:signal transduction histidine kinase
MLRSLRAKLIFAFLATSLVGTLLFLGITTVQTNLALGTFMLSVNREHTSDRLADYYRSQGTWEGVAEVVPMQTYVTPNGLVGVLRVQEERFVVTDMHGRVVVSGMGFQVGQIVPVERLRQGLPITVNGQRVGVLIVAPAPPPRPGDARQSFVARLRNSLLASAGGATLLALLLGVVLARSLTRPLRELTAATRAVSKGDLGQTIPVRSQDELGELASSFNQMSADLLRAQTLRRQMTADIAHELRTPLSLILGHAEALSDGVLPASPQTFDIIYDEAQRLTRLVEDLRTLSLSDAGELALLREPTAPASLLGRAAAAHAPLAEARHVRLTTTVLEDLPDLEVDPDRLGQVLHNLLSNALRFTPEGGEITLSAERHGAEAWLRVRDSGPGIAHDDLPYVFERFYRTDKARQRLEGGTGLGLSIARSLVEAHGGRLWAESAPGQGATFVIALPVS